MEKNTLNYFDRAIGSLNGRPDVTAGKTTTLRVVPPFGLGSHLYAVQTIREREAGDYIFIEMVSDEQTIRMVIPPSVAATIARQRDQLTGKVRSAHGRRIAEERKQRGFAPGFMKGKHGGKS